MKNLAFRALSISLVLAAGITAQSFGQSEPGAVRKPIIGINTDVDGDKPEVSSVQTPYIAAIRQAGGIPVLLPPMSEDDLKTVMPGIDGVLMIGGNDYPPSLYKQEQHHSVSLMKTSRSDFDILLAKTVLADKTIPFLGICAGCQALNIASGGSLTQDIPSAKPESKLKHASPKGWTGGFNKHTVEINADSKLAASLGTKELNVVSSHHQCVDKAGEGLTITAKAPDGVNEAIEKGGECYVIGVQWHPERDFESNKKLFEELVKRAAQRHNAHLAQAPSNSAAR